MASKTVAVIEVEIGDEVFDLFKSPKKDSILVREETENISKNFNYDLICAQTSCLSLALRVAYLGVANFPLFQVEVNRLAVDITKLTDESVRVLQKFQRAAVSINQSYIAACKYLTNSKKEFAQMEFRNVFKKSKEMEDAVSKLVSAFAGSTATATKIFNNVLKEIRGRDKTSGELNELEEALKTIENNIDKTTKQLGIAQKHEIEVAEKMGNIKRKFMTGMARVVTLGQAAKNTDEMEFEKCYEDKVRIQRQLRKYEVLFQKKLLKKLEKATALKPHENSKIQIENSTLSALDCCVKGLRHTQATLANVAEFWKRISEMNSDCGSSEDVSEHVKLIEETKYFEMYHDDEFRIKIKRQQAVWVALAIASNSCLESINTCNRELHVFIGEHYDPDTAMQKLQELMGSFLQRSKDMVYALEEDSSKSLAIASGQDKGQH